MKEIPYWETLCKNKEELQLYKSLRRTKAGRFIEFLYGEGYEDESDDFTEIVHRVGYYIGNWYEYYEEGETDDQGIRLPHIRTIENWMKKAERYCDYIGYRLERPYY